MKAMSNRTTDFIKVKNDVQVVEKAWIEIAKHWSTFEKLNTVVKFTSKAFTFGRSVLGWLDHALFEAELVQKVAPGKRPRRRHEWDGTHNNLGPFPLRIF